MPLKNMQSTIQVTPQSRVCFGKAEMLLWGEEMLPEHKRIIVITDSNLDRLHPQLVGRFEKIVIGLGEELKTLATVERIYQQLIEMGADRNCFLLGIGGGVVTDITGFTAATYMRGVEFAFISTTVLGMADAAVGGKNGVNVGGFKNMVGTFLQPKFVIMDVSLLRTLPERQFRAGMAEVIKSAVIADRNLFETLEKTSISELQQDENLLETVIAATVRIKAWVVAQDEKESGLRRILNFGHTLAHAIEKSSRKMVHGEAVAVGMLYAAMASENAGILAEAERARIAELIVRYGFSSQLPCDMQTLLRAMDKDKKREGDKIHFIMPVCIGEAGDYPMPLADIAALFQR